MILPTFPILPSKELVLESLSPDLLLGIGVKEPGGQMDMKATVQGSCSEGLRMGSALRQTGEGWKDCLEQWLMVPGCWWGRDGSQRSRVQRGTPMGGISLLCLLYCSNPLISHYSTLTEHHCMPGPSPDAWGISKTTGLVELTYI